MRDNGHPVKIHDIAGAQNIPPRFLEVILNELRHAGLVQSRRGNAGGYMLARRTEQLTVGHVIEYVQGPIAASIQEGQSGSPSEYFYGDHAFEELWAKLATAVSGICRNTTFAELVAYENQSRVRDVVDYVI